MIWLFVIIFPLSLAIFSWWLRPSSAWKSSLLLSAGAVPAVMLSLGVLTPEPAVISGLLLNAAFGLDTPRILMLTLASLLWGLAGAYAGSYIKEDRRRSRFFLFFPMVMAGNFGLIIAEDVASFYTFFVLMTFASFPLIIHADTREAHRAGQIYLIMAILGELFLIAGLYGLVHVSGSIVIDEIGGYLAGSGPNYLILFCILAGFGVKAGAIPLYFWLPLAHPVAPTPASAILSGVMIKAGLLGWMQFSGGGTAEFLVVPELLIGLGLLAAFGAAGIGFVQTDPKTTLAYSSISQMGLMTVILGIGLARPESWDAVLITLAFYAWHHGIAKGSLFLGTGVAKVSSGRRGRVLAGLFIPALALAGAPLTGGAIAKYVLADMTAGAPGFWETALIWVLPFSSLATSLLMGRFLWLAWITTGKGGPGSFGGLAWLWVISLILVLFGSYAVTAWFVLELPSPALTIAALWNAIWPILLAAILLRAGRQLLANPKSWSGRLPDIPPGDIIVLIERLARSLRYIWYRAGLLSPAGGAINFVPFIDRLIFEQTKGIVDRAEEKISTWTITGVFFMIIILAFIFFLG